MTKRRIKYVDTRLFGRQYAIVKQVKFLLFFRKWVCTHLCDSEKEARDILKYLESLPEEGAILYET